MIYYLDANAWSKLSFLQRNSKDEFVEILQLIKSKPDVVILYSKENVVETLKREILDNRKSDLICYRLVSHNMFIDFNGRVTIRDPNEVIQEIHTGEKISESLKSLFATTSPVLSNSENIEKIDNKDKLDKKDLNNVSYDKIVEVLEEKINSIFPKENIAISDEKILYYDSLRQAIVRIMHETLNGQIDTEEKELAIEKMIDTLIAFMKSIMEISTAKVNEAMQSENGFSPFELMKSAIPMKTYTTALLTSMLGAMQYHPDKKKLLERKEVDVDMNDINHVNYASYCNFFVTDDSKLAHRTMAAKHETGLVFEVINYDCFIQSIRE